MRRLGALSLLLSFVFAASARASDTPAGSWEGWIGISGGNENDLVFDTEPERITVPGGAFVDAAPGVALTLVPRERMEVRLSTEAAFERYANDEGRRLYTHLASGDLVFEGSEEGPRPGFRLSASGVFFDDSDRAASRRIDLGGEGAVDFTGNSARLELSAGGRWRRYPELEAVDAAGILGTYQEAGWSAGALGALLLGRGARGVAEIERRATDARGLIDDAVAWLVAVELELRMRSNVSLLASVVQERRTFTNRGPRLDEDDYIQAGAGVVWETRSRLDLRLQYAFARYHDPTSATQDTHRLELGATWRFGSAPRGRSGAWGEGALSFPGAAGEHETLGPPQRDGVVRFRIHAPAASEVSVAGDFNGWDPTAGPMTRGQDGWWSGERAIEPGVHEYVYVVDGEWVTPPEAEVTVEDGFGGRNGILEVR